MLQRLCVRIRSTRLSLARMQRTLARTSSTVAYSMLAFLPVSSPRAERVCCLRSCDCDSPAMPFAGVPVCQFPCINRRLPTGRLCCYWIIGINFALNLVHMLPGNKLGRIARKKMGGTRS
jgi:hypothetical protein